tara:strand:+ start:411 stop:815 length:405 start_codon:yes stop_codon:yes gene_type:complete
MNIFAQGLIEHLRFKVSNGTATIEQLFDLPLTSANGPSLVGAITVVHDELETTGGNRFLKKTATSSKATDTLKLKMEILEFIIDLRETEKLDRATKAKNKALLNKLVDIQAQKDDEALLNLTDAERAEMIAKLK